MGAKCVSRSRTNNKPETTHEVKTFTHPRLIELEVKTQELDDFFDSFEMYVEINTPNATPREIRAVPKTYKNEVVRAASILMRVYRRRLARVPSPLYR